MTASKEQQLVLRLLRMAADSQPVPAEGHFVEDEELLTCWSMRLLSARQQQKIIDHLVICPPCRRILGEMIREGVLELSEPTGETLPEGTPENVVSVAVSADAQSSATTVRVSGRRDHRSRWSMFSRQIIASRRLAVAASVLVAMAAIWWALTPPQPKAVLAMAERELRDGNAQAALNRIDQLLAKDLDEQIRSQAEGLLEASGYAAASKSLTSSDFRKVLEIEDRVTRRIGGQVAFMAGPGGGPTIEDQRRRSTGRLDNLRLQAERGVPSELALDSAGSLTDYGYELDGTSPKKTLPVVDQTTERLDREFDAAVRLHFREEKNLWLNRGQFLLSLARYDQARKCFQQALAIDPQHALAHLGLGLVAFELRDFDSALAHFEQSVRLAPGNAAAHINLGICLTRLGRKEDAVRQFRLARNSTSDTRVRQRIDEQLHRLGEK